MSVAGASVRELIEPFSPWARERILDFLFPPSSPRERGAGLRHGSPASAPPLSSHQVARAEPGARPDRSDDDSLDFPTPRRAGYGAPRVGPGGRGRRYAGPSSRSHPRPGAPALEGGDQPMPSSGGAKGRASPDDGAGDERPMDTQAGGGPGTGTGACGREAGSPTFTPWPLAHPAGDPPPATLVPAPGPRTMPSTTVEGPPTRPVPAGVGAPAQRSCGHPTHDRPGAVASLSSPEMGRHAEALWLDPGPEGISDGRNVPFPVSDGDPTSSPATNPTRGDGVTPTAGDHSHHSDRTGERRPGPRSPIPSGVRPAEPCQETTTWSPRTP